MLCRVELLAERVRLLQKELQETKRLMNKIALFTFRITK
jgi:hypothetical protein